MRGNVLANMPNGLETGLEHGGGLIGPTDVRKVETRQGRSWDRLAVKGVPAGCVCDRHFRRHRQSCFHLVFCFWSLRRIAGDSGRKGGGLKCSQRHFGPTASEKEASKPC